MAESSPFPATPADRLVDASTDSIRRESRRRSFLGSIARSFSRWTSPSSGRVIEFRTPIISSASATVQSSSTPRDTTQLLTSLLREPPSSLGTPIELYPLDRGDLDLTFGTSSSTHVHFVPPRQGATDCQLVLACSSSSPPRQVGHMVHTCTCRRQTPYRQHHLRRSSSHSCRRHQSS